MFLIDWMITQSAVTLYIYRVEWTYLVKNPFYRSKSTKKPNSTRTPLGPVRPVGPTGQTGRAPAESATAPYRSDRLVRPLDANFGCQHMPPCFFLVKLACKKKHSSEPKLSKDDD